MKYLTIIPARGGSKGLPNKNIKLVNGKPLICWSIEHSVNCHLIDRTIVSTDSEEIAAISRNSGAEVPSLRPENLAEDQTPTEPVLLHVLSELRQKEGYEPDAVVLLQPTSPLRKKGRLHEAINYFEQTHADSLVSVSPNHHFFWKNLHSPEALYNYEKRPRRQDIKESDRWFQENGSIYITKKEILYSVRNRLGGKIAAFLMDEQESIEIDSELDCKIVEFLIRELKYEN
ncbi:acylneuraminate cytidylyltransferase family protein [Sporolactobacillus sp. CPB3-1]|uniref:Acylneuraminate cytidylyltransferase family protein n=1 Tax=Sporolactobacillus mangiferae TaxID=2940498 RepID=A0ABT0MBP4_9BACL|nr:acylneuraminate cytidylyltransferase family protein [Sporolactobacillus mangiferae]MCL1632287.1 acylneuraminate cytidylyltransferase family protein [Sporolactobacillus mangiferae]